jgi:hypothetical protein
LVFGAKKIIFTNLKSKSMFAHLNILIENWESEREVNTTIAILKRRVQQKKSKLTATSFNCNN